MAKSRSTSSRGTSADLFQRVADLARNLWWTWKPDPQRLFAALDPVQWEATRHNPLRTLVALSAERRAALREDAAFAALLEMCERQLRTYLKARTWVQGSEFARARTRVAYFCAEFALHECLPIYSGGLGVLAGDHLKSASDLGIPLVAVGLLYRQGYYRQEFNADGSTHVVYPHFDFADLPIVDTRKMITVPIGRRQVQVRIWRVQVGRVPLYLLDTDVPTNAPSERRITSRLYGGDHTLRIQQEILLGVGGVRALAAVGERCTKFHLNEGHAAFCNVERLRQLHRSGVSPAAALERVRASSVFTTHTPVPAGHDRFPAVMVRKHLRNVIEELAIAPKEFMGLGREKPEDRAEPFCMTVLALRTSAQCNGVAAIHGRVSREMWTGVYNTKDPRRVPIDHVTNGVHAETWLAPEMRTLYERYVKPRWDKPAPTPEWWTRVARIPAAELWRMRGLLRRRLVQFIRDDLRAQVQRQCGPLAALVAVLDTFDEDVLTIGFARRFATYKRAPLVFREPKRLAAILEHAKQPVQFVFAGKAHPADQGGQAFAQQIYSIAHKNGFAGRVAVLENYDMYTGRMLTSGCDVWLNNPLPPQEASGTSGMKPPLHGGLNCSILDGWWPEAWNGKNGWAIQGGPAKSRTARDRLDAQAIYTLLESQIVPLFYRRDRAGVPQGWVKAMKASMQTVGKQFNTHRMLAEYMARYAR